MRCAATASWALLCSAVVACSVSVAQTAPQPEAAQQAEATQPAEAGKPSETPPPGAAANAATPRVTFQFERAGVMVPQFLVAIDEAGNASYAAEEALPQQEGTPAATRHVEQKAVLTRATTNRIFTLARASDRFNLACASLAKNVADLGRKTLHYTGPDGEGSCVFNFSENKSIVELTNIVQQIVRTLDAGRKLDFDHRFDRLGLDQDTAALVEDVDEGRAIEVGTIAHTLRSIAADPEVLERVRGRAASLLQRFPPAG